MKRTRGKHAEKQHMKTIASTIVFADCSQHPFSQVKHSHGSFRTIKKARINNQKPKRVEMKKSTKKLQIRRSLISEKHSNRIFDVVVAALQGLEILLSVVESHEGLFKNKSEKTAPIFLFSHQFLEQVLNRGNGIGSRNLFCRRSRYDSGSGLDIHPRL